MAQPGVLVAIMARLSGAKRPRSGIQCNDRRYIARLAYRTELINPKSHQVSAALLRKHYERKHGPKAYYGQKHD